MFTFATPIENGGQAIIDNEAGFDICLVGLAGSQLLQGAPLRPNSSSRSRRKQSLRKDQLWPIGEEHKLIVTRQKLQEIG